METKTHQFGFSIVEVIVAVFLFLVIAGYTLLNFPRVFQKTAIHVGIDTVVNDLRLQQIKSLTGDTEGRGITDNYGVYFQTANYTLFHGTTYNANDTTNQVINFQNNTQLSNITFSNSLVIFAKGSGETLGFVPNSNTITLKNTVSGETKTITLNRYGIITKIQ